MRGVELEAEAFLKGTRVDGIYTADPEKDPTATRFDELTFDEAFARNLKIMDLTAFAMCKENALNVEVFNMDIKGNLGKLMRGEAVGTLLHA